MTLRKVGCSVVDPTWGEVYGWIVLLVLFLGFYIFAWFRGKREEERTVTWIRDWEEEPWQR